MLQVLLFSVSLPYKSNIKNLAKMTAIIRHTEHSNEFSGSRQEVYEAVIDWVNEFNIQDTARIELVGEGVYSFSEIETEYNELF